MIAASYKKKRNRFFPSPNSIFAKHWENHQTGENYQKYLERSANALIDMIDQKLSN